MWSRVVWLGSHYFFLDPMRAAAKGDERVKLSLVPAAILAYFEQASAAIFRRRDSALFEDDQRHFRLFPLNEVARRFDLAEGFGEPVQGIRRGLVAMDRALI